MGFGASLEMPNGLPEASARGERWRTRARTASFGNSQGGIYASLVFQFRPVRYAFDTRVSTLLTPKLQGFQNNAQWWGFKCCRTSR